MRTFHVPALFIFTLDITLKYISVLGEICVDILRSIIMRSVGKIRTRRDLFQVFLASHFLNPVRWLRKCMRLCAAGDLQESMKKSKNMSRA